MVNKRTAFLSGYNQLNVFIPFLSSFFITRPRDIRRAESFKIEVKRGTSKIAPAVSSLSARGGKIVKSLFTQKEFTPPIVALGTDFNPADLTNKAFDMTEYETADMEYVEQLQAEIAENMMEIDNQMQRNPEFQASQILTTGAMTLYDDKGQEAFTISFFPKATHFPTVGTAWSDPAADMDGDLISLYEVIKRDGKVNANNIIFSKESLTEYLDGTAVKVKFDTRRIESGTFDPSEVNPDVNFLGDILIGYKRFQCWLYEGEYENPAAANDNMLPFVPANKVIMLPDGDAMNVDFRKVWCIAPTITGVDPRFSSIVPSSLQLTDRQYTNRVWTEGGDDSLNIELKARPLCVPVSIDAFGCLTTTV